MPKAWNHNRFAVKATSADQFARLDDLEELIEVVIHVVKEFIYVVIVGHLTIYVFEELKTIYSGWA